jgi:glycerophosphoryl diester phosphodiesterase
VEFDIRATKDGEPVVVHDATMTRVAGSRLSVSDLTYRDLKALDAGSWFAPQFAGERVPHLEDVLDLLGDSVYYDIELKVVSRSIVNKVAELLEKYGLTRRAVVSSFSPQLVGHRRVFASMAPILTPSYPLRYLSWRTLHRRSIAPAYLKPDIAFFQRRNCFRGLARELRRQTIPWIPWTINDAELGRYCLENGAAGLISNDPARLARELGLPLT